MLNTLKLCFSKQINKLTLDKEHYGLIWLSNEIFDCGQ